MCDSLINVALGSSESSSSERTDSAAAVACKELLLVCNESFFRLDVLRCKRCGRAALSSLGEPRRAVDLALKPELRAVSGRGMAWPAVGAAVKSKQAVQHGQNQSFSRIHSSYYPCLPEEKHMACIARA